MMNNKILPVALVAALLGGSAGAFIMRPSKTAEMATTTATTATNAPVAPAHTTATTAPAVQTGADELALNPAGAEREAYRAGFAEGVRASRDEELTTQTTRRVAPSREVARTRVVYRNSRGGSRAARTSNQRQVYYDYEQPQQKRSFWQKHRDKLTVAGGAGAGAIIGGLIGGKKGALIGAAAGGGGGALYTYKIRKRDRRY